jgi:hypothetical protein
MMSSQPRLPTLALRAALTLALALPLASTALAQQANLNQVYHVGQNDAFGAQQDNAVLRAARIGPSAPALTAEQRSTLEKTYRVGENSDFGADRTDQPVMAQRDYQSRVAAGVPLVGGKRDLVGMHGPQDDLARQIYSPGHFMVGIGG